MDSILQNFVVDFMLGYNAFHIPGGRSVPDPTTYLSDVTSPLMVAKFVVSSLTANMSDIIMVRGLMLIPLSDLTN